MSRSDRAEQTYQKILEVSAKLFHEQGYEKTSIQDILNELKMSKGAVYHHFKSKKEILDAIQDRGGNQRLELLHQLAKEVQGENAREKLTQLLLKFFELGDFSQIDKDLLSAHLEDPHMVLADIRAQMNDAKLLVDLLEEGIRDGSIKTEYPLELAEVTFILTNTWLNPVVFNRDFKQTERRLKFLQQVLSRLGADFVSDEIIDEMLSRFQSLGYFE